MVTAVTGILVLLIVAGGAVYGTMQLFSLGGYEDYEGAGSGRVVIEVNPGDTTRAIGQTLAEKNVVASSTAFVVAAQDNRQIVAVQPGFYLMRSKMSGSAAVERITSDDAGVGRVEIRGGMLLDDKIKPDGKVTKGILTLLAEATCVEEKSSKVEKKASECVTSEEMHAAAKNVDLAKLELPQWVVEGASNAPDPLRRLEGLMLPGIYDVKPTDDPVVVLRSVLSTSMKKLDAVGFPQIADGSKPQLSPYELLTIASLTQSEGIREDFGKVARVIKNRLSADMRLGLDSTINYRLKNPTLLTPDEARARKGPYNTYQKQGLTPTPISAPSTAAIKAAADPADGQWRYFVKCYKNGKSCFSETIKQHEKAKDEAQKRGAW